MLPISKYWEINFFTLAGIQKKSLSYIDFFEPRLYPLHEGVENSRLRTLSSNLALKNGLKLRSLEQTLSEYWLGILKAIDTMSLGGNNWKLTE